MKDTRASIHWWYQRITSLLLIPITIWFLYILSNYAASNKAETIIQAFQNIAIQYPLIILITTLILVFHMKMGMQEIIEDYVHTQKTKLLSIIILNILAIRIITDTFIYLYI